MNVTVDPSDWTLGLALLVLPLVFISVFEYRIAGSSPSAVLVGGIVLSIGTVFVVSQLLSRVFGRKSKIDYGSVTIGTGLISAVVFGTYSELSATEYGDWAPLLTVGGAVIVVTFWVGNRTAGDSIDGLQQGFFTAGASGILTMGLVSYEAITREVVFNALVAITSVGIPLALGTVGAISGLLGGLFAQQRSKARTTPEL